MRNIVRGISFLAFSKFWCMMQVRNLIGGGESFFAGKAEIYTR